MERPSALAGRTSAGILALALVALGVAGLMRAFGGPARATAHPTPTSDLGIFTGLGGWIAYASPLGGIWAMDPERPGMKAVRLSTEDGEPLAWSRDGSKLLIQREQPTKSGPTRTALYVLSADGSETLLVHGGDHGSFSPDGSEVVYCRDSGRDSANGIYVVDANGGTPTRLLNSVNTYDPALSSYGSHIAYFEGPGDEDNTLRVMDADGSGSRVRLPDEGMMHNLVYPGNLAWFPAGNRLMFDAVPLINKTLGWESIYMVNADGSDLTRLGAGTNPFLSPDGSRIAYGDSVLRYRLLIENVDGTHVQRFDNAEPGPWNPLPRATSGAHSTSVPPGATRPDWITFSSAALIALGLAVFWLRRKGPATPADLGNRHPGGEVAD